MTWLQWSEYPIHNHMSQHNHHHYNILTSITTWHNSIINMSIVSFLIKSIKTIVPFRDHTLMSCASPSSIRSTLQQMTSFKKSFSHAFAYASNLLPSSSSSQSSAGNSLSLNLNGHHVDDSRIYRRLLVQLEETERRFDEFWGTHLARLKQCLELRRFEQDFRELQVNTTAHT